ncbi:MAG: histidinol dehydrogenase [Gammaproteobacteria bacterium]|nr:histidinol dehydrogenase [Gammaproteobacteria bacterium]
MLGNNLNTDDKAFISSFEGYFNKRALFTLAISNEVKELVNQIKEKGDEALIELTNKFDKRRVSSVDDFLVSAAQIEESYSRVDPKVISAMKFSYERILDFHRNYINKDHLHTNSKLGKLSRPLESILVYAPGGKASYPSTVLMAVGPAKVAGVKKIYLTSPFMGGKFNDLILAASFIAGVDQVFSIGGAQGIASFAYGSKTIPRVNKIIGPGNKYVSEAKRLLYGTVGIDMIAGPSELVVYADNSANPSIVAIDLIAQAEHDDEACSILITNDSSLIEKVNREIKRYLEALARKKTIKKSLMQSGLSIVVKNTKEAIEIINKIAPEHLQIISSDAEVIGKKIEAAGVILIGQDSATALSDYVLGPSHILPTMGSSKFSSGLSIGDFLISSSYVNINSQQREYKDLITNACILEEAEGLTAHSMSLKERMRIKD